MVGRKEHRVVGVELGQGLGVALVGGRDVAGDRRLDRAAAGRLRGRLAGRAPGTGAASRPGRKSEGARRCHFGVVLARIRGCSREPADPAPRSTLKPGFLWHADHADIPQSPSPASVVPPVVPCSRTAIGSSAQHGSVCAYCGSETSPEVITLDHVRPRRGQTAYDRAGQSGPGLQGLQRGQGRHASGRVSDAEARRAGCFSSTMESTSRSPSGSSLDRRRNDRSSPKSDRRRSR